MAKEVDAVEAVKALAEMTFIFYRHCLDLGASPREADGMTRAYISAALGTNGRKEDD